MNHIDIIIIILSFVIGLLATDGNKTQFVRILDICVYGPFLIFIGFKFDNVFMKYLLFFMGATTMSYNLKNYLNHK